MVWGEEVHGRGEDNHTQTQTTINHQLVIILTPIKPSTKGFGSADVLELHREQQVDESDRQYGTHADRHPIASFHTERRGNCIVNRSAVFLLLWLYNIKLMCGWYLDGRLWTSLDMTWPSYSKSSLCVRLFTLQSFSSILDAIIYNHSLEMEM